MRSLRFWFRKQYRLASTDPRYLAMTDEDILLEYEAHLAFNGEILKTCPRCALETHRKKCPECGITLTGDQVMDDALARVEAGEEVDLDALLRPGSESRHLPPSEEWEPIPPGEMP